MSQKTIIENWRFCFAENRAAGFSVCRISDLEQYGLPFYPAKVPACFEAELALNGLEPEPYFSDHVYRFRKYESYHQWYFAGFDLVNGENTLVFGGIDTVADIYVNGELCGHTENMFLPHEFTIPSPKARGNEVLVHIFPAVLEARKYPLPAMAYAAKYNYPSLSLRKAAYSFGWDIFPRLVAGGLWREVCLVRKEPSHFQELYLYTAKIGEGECKLNLFFSLRNLPDSLENLSLFVEGRCGSSAFSYEEELWHTAGTLRFSVNAPKLWWPRGYGEQNLYTVRVTLKENGVSIEEKTLVTGIRTVELEHSSIVRAGGKFQFLVNGKKIFILGANWVPPDASHRDHDGQMRMALPMVTDLNCNLLRVWGGGYYETDEFYDWCDREGILVWQDFMLGCAVYPATARMKELLGEEAEAVIKRLREHPCILLWAGDNECDLAHGWLDFARKPFPNGLTRTVIAEAVRLHDGLRPYLPSSPYVDEVAADFPDLLPEDHLWGPRDYFRGNYYKNAPCYFASETGYHGCNSLRSLKKFLKNPREMFLKDGRVSEEYLAHASSAGRGQQEPNAYRIPLMAAQVKTLFPGELSFENFIRASQISQAEALKYFVERFRMAREEKGGIVWWNLIDGWPQVSDAVVDFYGEKKLAYSFLKRSQQPLCLMCGEEGDTLKLYAVNDTLAEKQVTYSVRRALSGEEIMAGRAKCRAESSSLLCTAAFPHGEKAFYFIEWSDGENTYTNHYVTNCVGLNLEEYLTALTAAGYNLWKEEE